MNTVKPYKSLIMEIRPRLQSVNVFIILNDTSDDVRINLGSDHFEIIVGSIKGVVECRQFRIVVGSLSCFLAEDNWVTFRFSTDNLTHESGSLHTEIVKIDTETNNQNYDAEICLKTGVGYDISCANCLCVFHKGIVFERILPLPVNSDPSEWFCHGHNQNTSLIPKLSEIFYSLSFVYVNDSLLNGITKSNTNLICQRCLSWAGVSKPGVHKIWFNTVTFSNNNNSLKSNALDDVFKVIKQLLNSSLSLSIRIVLSCQSLPFRTDFVLLWVLERRLKVRFEFDQTTNADVAKVLFKFDANRSDLVTQWLNDINVTTVDISKPMMVKLLEDLYGANRYVPKNFSISNDFYVSYLRMYTDNQ